MGQYVIQNGKKYYKADDGQLYSTYRGAQLGNTLTSAARGVGSVFNDILQAPGAMLSAFYDPTKVGRPAAAEELGQDKKDTKIRPHVPPTAPITSPNTTFQHADDEYKRLLSQYGGAPGVEQLAMQTSLPTGFTPTGAKGPASLKDFYSAERQVGGRNIESIIGQMGYQGEMADWARNFPMLAQREYAKAMSAKQEAAGYGGYGTGQPVADPALQGTTASFFPGDQASFSGAANAVPAPPTQQGAAVSAPFAPAQAKAAEKTAGATGMPAFAKSAGDAASNLGEVFLKTVLPGTAIQSWYNRFGGY